MYKQLQGYNHSFLKDIIHLLTTLKCHQVSRPKCLDLLTILPLCKQVSIFPKVEFHLRVFFIHLKFRDNLLLSRQALTQLLHKISYQSRMLLLINQ